jgi:hypothetical protein
MSTHDVFVEEFAKLFVHYQEALKLTGGEVKQLGSVNWEDLPPVERERMVAAARLALLELEADNHESSRRWYARPGDAEWGC